MSTFSEQLKTVLTLISSNSKQNKSHGYSTLSHLQQQSTDDENVSCSIQILVDNSPTLVPLILRDVSYDDEELAVQALKCLGFMIYHPSIVAAIPGDDANSILDSLVNIVTTTKIKSVCNLGVWCISMQQFSISVLSAHHHSLLRAVVHGLDNPFGSLSTTFEAIQAVIKLALQSSHKMRDLCYMWLPPIYRRLLSIDKREKDMSERCLLKIRSIVLPPPATLSKALVRDMKKTLLTEMKKLLSRAMKVQAIQAWGWYIRFMGTYAIKNRQLVNDMLKIPEETFSDRDAQVHIASQVAWEGLIDALIETPVNAKDICFALDRGHQQVQSSGGNIAETEARGLLKSMKLIMMPITGIISSKPDLSIYSSCANTWLYLLHKVNTFLNCSSVIKLVLEPILQQVFQSKSDSRCIWLWNLCVDLLNDFISAKYRDSNCELDEPVAHLTSVPSTPESSQYSRGLSKQYCIKWYPWDLSHLDFLLNMISKIIRQPSASTETSENILPFNAALRLYRSVLKGVRVELKKSYVNFSDSMSCLSTILTYNKRISEDAISEGESSHLLCTSLLLIQTAAEELEPFLLGSPLHKVALDLNYIEQLSSSSDFTVAEGHRMSSIVYKSMVSPITYLIALYFSVVVCSTSSSLNTMPNHPTMYKFFELVFSIYEPAETFLPTIDLLYRHVGISYLTVWREIARGFMSCISLSDSPFVFCIDSDSAGYHAIDYLISYPLFACCPLHKETTKLPTSGSMEQSDGLSREDLEEVIEVLETLFKCVNSLQSKFGSYENLCSMLSEFIDKRVDMHPSASPIDGTHKKISSNLILSGSFVKCVLESLIKSGSAGNESRSGSISCSGITNSLGSASRFMKFSLMYIRIDSQLYPLITRVCALLAQLFSSLCSRQEIVSSVEIISSGLLPWLSHGMIPDQHSSDKLQLVWDKILNSLLRSQPPIIFDSSFLKFQAPMLEKTLDHPNPSIAESTLKFWNSTYGEQHNLDYPQILLNVLDKLSRTGRLILHKKHAPFLAKCRSKIDTDPMRYRVMAKQNMSSKRIELVEDAANAYKHQVMLPNLKRKRQELTEHQKEVRRAQQGRGRDCSGHGPGIRTYTSVDFSQGNEDSQESQDIDNPECFLKKLGLGRS